MTQHISNAASKRFIIYLPYNMINAIDQALLNERKRGGIYVSRSVAIAAIIESVDVPTLIAKLAKGTR